MNGWADLLKKSPRLYALLRHLYRCLVIQPLAWPKWKSLARAPQIKLELGSGAKKGRNGWTTVDLYGADIRYDLRKGIPLGDNTVDAIYCSHLLEHIPYQPLLRFIGECRRVLKPAGTFSVCVPNGGLYIRAYLNKEVFSDPLAQYQGGAVDTGSYLDQVNYLAYMGGEHAYLFDEENLVNTLRRGGFDQVRLRAFDPTLDLPERDYCSIYALAIKD